MDTEASLATLQLKEWHANVVAADQSTIENWERTLGSALNRAYDERESLNPNTILDSIKTIVNNKSKNKYLFSILLTACVKKALDPRQDIRIGQKNMPGGYANRTLDQASVTPFLKREGYTHCQASGLESGRNFERPLPWDLSFPTKPKGEGNREAFLGLLDYIQVREGDTGIVAMYLLYSDRERSDSIEATSVPPVEPMIDNIMKVLTKHFDDSKGQGKSRLPVLALYAIYEQLVQELDRYSEVTLLPLERHTTADLRSGSIGDIQLDKDGEPFEGVEVKSEISITADMIWELPRKFNGRHVSRYYILSTAKQYIKEKDLESVMVAVKEVQRVTGTQIIPNGLIRTIWYYLRLLSDPSNILRRYAELLEVDPDVRMEMKGAWNQIIHDEYSGEC